LHRPLRPRAALPGVLFAMACNSLAGNHEATLAGVDAGLADRVAADVATDSTMDARSEAAIDAPTDAPPTDASCSVNLQTDPDNCGRCGHSCLGGACTTGQCQPITIAAGQDYPWALTLANASVYWANDGADSGVLVCPTSGCVDAGASVIASNQVFPSAVAVDATNVYWTTAGTLSTCPLSGCPAGPVVLASATQPLAVAQDAVNLYWTEFNFASPAAGSVYACPKPGCVPITTVASSQTGPFGVAVDDAGIYWLDNAAMPPQLAQCQLACGSPSFTPISPNDPRYIATDGTRIYWTDRAAVWACSEGACDAGVLAPNQQSASGIALDTGNVYWASSGNGAIMTCSKTACSPIVLALGQAQPHGVAVDSVAVYWTNTGATSGAGSVMKVAKP
jgi:hypothetical protein